MNWSDERYIRFYTRDTVTWKRWSWEARAVFGLLLRKVDRSGILDTGSTDKVESLALMLEVPAEVAARAVNEWLACGTVTEVAQGFVVPTFIEAQEAAQTDAARQRESRAKRRAATMQNTEAPCHTVSQPVTGGHTVSHGVTPAVPSQPCLAEPAKKISSSDYPHPLAVVWNENRAPTMPKWSTTDGTRRKHADARLRDHELDVWAEVVKRLAASDFASGRGGKWSATPDWLVKAPGNAIKVLEGHYDNRQAPPGANTRSPAPVADWSTVTPGEVSL